jgi:hypothetical protein
MSRSIHKGPEAAVVVATLLVGYQALDEALMLVSRAWVVEL